LKQNQRKGNHLELDRPSLDHSADRRSALSEERKSLKRNASENLKSIP